MKKVTLLSFVALLTVFVFYTACKKDNKAPKITAAADNGSDDAALLSTYANVGTLHNAGLDFIYNQLLTYKNAQIQATGKFACSKSTLFSLYNQYAADYVDTLWQLTDSQYAYTLSNIESFNLDAFKNNTTYSLTYIAEQTTLVFSPALTNAVNMLFAIGDSTTLTDSAKYAAWDTLLYQNIDLVSNDVEKAGLICAINTAIATYKYWETPTNVSKWNSLLSDLTQARTTKTTAEADNWKADVVGALSGGASGAIDASWLGVGGAIAGGVCGAVAGACSATAGSCITSLIWSWIGW